LNIPLIIRLETTVTIPDKTKLARYERAPELGPRLLFFSGGSALKPFSQHIIRYTHNSIHLITPFDSGGSSAELRKAFHMLSVGDIRNRLLALADQSVRGNAEVYRLFAYRFPKNESNTSLQKRLDDLICSRPSLIRNIPNPMRKIIRNHLRDFRKQMPVHFDLRGANIGNLILAAGYLNNERQIDPVIFIFSRLVEARGIVRPTIGKDLHLVAELEDGTTVIGQHAITGKETAPLAQRIRRIYLSGSPDEVEPVDVEIRSKVKKLIAKAELICFPYGSFYSSLMANLLPHGIGAAIEANHCPKLFIPNLGHDPEQQDLPVHESVARLLDHLKSNLGRQTETNRLLNFVLIDSENGDYREGCNLKKLRQLGPRIIDTKLVSKNDRVSIDPEKLAPVLLSLT